MWRRAILAALRPPPEVFENLRPTRNVQKVLRTAHATKIHEHHKTHSVLVYSVGVAENPGIKFKGLGCSSARPQSKTPQDAK